VDKLAELIQAVIKAIPWLLWPILGLLFLWGLVLISKQFYSLFHQARKNYITELREHLDFKETVINDYYAQNTQLQMQNYEIKMEAEKKQELINETIETALAIMTEKDTELQTLKSESDMKIQQTKFALGTALWVIERETWMRRIFLALLTKAQVPADIEKLLEKYIGSIIPIIQSDEAICFQEVDPEADYFEAKTTALAPHYLLLPIKDDISLIEKIKDELLTLPSFIDSGNPPSDDKTACREGADDKT